MKKILTLILALLWVGISCLGIPSLIERGYQAYYGQEEVYLITGNSTVIPFLLGIACMILYIWMFAPDGICMELGEPGIKAQLPRNKKILILVISIVVLGVGTLGSTFFYDKFGLDGVESRCFLGKKEYTWSDIDYVTLKADAHGVLMYVMYMEDGAKHYFNGGLVRTAEYGSIKFEEKFPEGTYDYMVWLSMKFKAQNIELRIPDKDKLFSKLGYDSWKELAEQVIAVWEDEATY